MKQQENETRAQLQVLKAELMTLSAIAADDRKPVSLDQQAVGRLSRQDSLQVQAMAKAADARRVRELRRIDAALVRLDEGEYGYCTQCGDEIESGRLAIDPATPLCRTCAITT